MSYFCLWRYHIFTCKDIGPTIQWKARRIFYWINQIQCFIIRISVAVCWFQFVWRKFIFWKKHKFFFLRAKSDKKNFQMADPHFTRAPIYYFLSPVCFLHSPNNTFDFASSIPAFIQQFGPYKVHCQLAQENSFWAIVRWEKDIQGAL